MAFRPAGLLSELLEQGEARVRAVIWAVLLGWSAFLLAAVGLLSLVAYLLDAPWWAYLLVATIGLALLAPVVFAALVALAGIRTWVGRAQDAARLEAAVLVDEPVDAPRYGAPGGPGSGERR